MCFISRWIYSCNCKHLVQDAPEICPFAEAQKAGLEPYCKEFQIRSEIVNYPCSRCKEAVVADRKIVQGPQDTHRKPSVAL